MRKANDFYPTEAAVTKQLLKIVPNINGNVLEPCAGDGAIARVFDKHQGVDVVYTNDINQAWDCNYHQDASKTETWKEWKKTTKFEWIVTNPPFNQAHLILPLAYKSATVGVAFLLRLSYLEPAGNRGEWLRSYTENLSNLIILGQPRPSFTGDGKTDSCTVAWMVWQKNHSDDTKIDFAFNWKK